MLHHSLEERLRTVDLDGSSFFGQARWSARLDAGLRNASVFEAAAGVAAWSPTSPAREAALSLPGPAVALPIPIPALDGHHRIQSDVFAADDERAWRALIAIAGDLPLTGSQRLVLEADRGAVIGRNAAGEDFGLSDSHARVSVVETGDGVELARASAIIDGLPEPQAFLTVVQELAGTASARANEIGSRQRLPAGIYTVAFVPSAMATVAHEVIGHVLEDDHYEGFLRRAGGAALFPEFLNVALSNEGDWVNAERDDRGDPVITGPIVQGGAVLARLGDNRSLGTWRREHWGFPAIPRMRGLVVRGRTEWNPGDRRGAELLVDEVGLAGVNPRTGQCVIEVISSSSETTPYRGGRIAMPATQLLSALVELAVELGPAQSSYCLKSRQKIRVSSASGYGLFREVIVA